MSRSKYPIGIQTFAEIRENGYIYVDKTEFIHELVSNGKYYFLSRPRRFGKSLLISTFESFFRGKRDLFKGLAIDSMDWDWDEYPVFHLDFSGKVYEDLSELDDILSQHLRLWEVEMGYTMEGRAPDDRFKTAIRTAAETSGRKVVILIDEYDQPLVHNIANQKLLESFRKKLSAFYSVLKNMDAFIQFALITGVSRFSKVSIFSGLNNLKDISLLSKYNAICGITESELSEYFAEGIREMADEEGISTAQLHDNLKSNYDGYHFSKKGDDIYNPFSLLNTFSNLEFGSYWLATGTTSSLLEVLKVNEYPLQELEGCKATENMLNGADIFLSDPIPLFFQTGYLTIKDYDQEFKQYILGFPNREVTEGFNDLVLKTWMRVNEPATFVSDFVKDVRAGKAEAFMEKIKYFFAGIPYDHAKKDKAGKDDEESGIRGSKEVHYQNVLYVIMKLMGFYTNTEYRTSDGRIDMVVETKDYVYVMEFKIDSTARAALDQIEDKGYAEPFRITGKKIYKIGANFDTRTRRLSDYIIV